jgi:hypothetical protein
MTSISFFLRVLTTVISVFSVVIEFSAFKVPAWSLSWPCVGSLEKFECPRDLTVLRPALTAVTRSALPTHRYMAHFQNFFLIVSPTAAWTSDDTPTEPTVGC